VTKFVKLSTLAATLAVISGTSFAATPTAAQLSREISKLQAQTTSLQNEVRSLQASKRRAVMRHRYADTNSTESYTGSHTIPEPTKLAFHGISVTTSPYIGLRSSPDASDQLINAPSLNEDLYLLLQRDQLDVSPEYSYPNSPLLEFSGDILGGANFGNTTNITLNGFDLDLEALASKWALGMVSLSYSDGSNDYLSEVQAINNSITTNSNIYLNRAFVTLGNLNAFPVYGTFGQMYVPFGSYSNYMVTTPLTQYFGRTDAPAAEIGFFKKGFNFDTFAFEGSNKMDNNASVNNRWGLSGSYVFTTKIGEQKFGAGYISTITDSLGLNGSQLFVTNHNRSASLTKSIPAVDLNTKLNWNKFTFLGEYIWTTTNFALADFNTTQGVTADAISKKPSVLDLEAIYAFNLYSWSSNFAIDFGKSSNAAYLAMPQTTIAGIFNTSPFKNTVLSAELRHDGSYSKAVRDTTGNAIKTGTMLSLQAALYF
jgi:hypothetical protein